MKGRGPAKGPHRKVNFGTGTRKVNFEREPVMTNEEIRRTAATVIAKARDNHPAAIPDGAAAFDYAVAAGDRNAWIAIQNAIYEVANPDWMTTSAPSADLDARTAALSEQLVDELDTYRERCKARKYTGWSNASDGPIRYAGWK